MGLLRKDKEQDFITIKLKKNYFVMRLNYKVINDYYTFAQDLPIIEYIFKYHIKQYKKMFKDVGVYGVYLKSKNLNRKMK